MQRIDTLPRLRRRAVDVNKVTAGRVLVVGGSRNMTGAPALAGLAALRAGAGLVKLAVPGSIQPTVAAYRAETVTAGLPESKGGGLGTTALETLSTLAEDWDAIVLGPGAGRIPATIKISRRFALAVARPLVIDADGLFAWNERLAQMQGRPAPTVLTPHEGEAARLLGTDSAEIRSNREDAAMRIAQASSAIVVLKGPGTLVTDGQRLFENRTGGPHLATAGTGDVLAGIAGAFLADLEANAMDPFEAACAAVHVHGSAGDMLAQTVDRGLLASDIAHTIPQAIAQIVDPVE
ncbi:MAG: NAD(P)H-hydrate dehydratase [Planctomycetota bacterium]|nr:NAD(P)H-hydrate dehydratase [Planctomycetota bacterium]